MEDRHLSEIDGTGGDAETIAVRILHAGHELSEQRFDVAQPNLLVADVAEIDNEGDGLTDFIRRPIAGTETDACFQSVRFLAPSNVVGLLFLHARGIGWNLFRILFLNSSRQRLDRQHAWSVRSFPHRRRGRQERIVPL